MATSGTFRDSISVNAPPPDEVAVSQHSRRLSISNHSDGHNEITQDTRDTELLSVIDILPDGSIFDRNHTESSAPRCDVSAVNSPPKSKSIRVIFRATDDVFAASSQDPVVQRRNVLDYKVNSPAFDQPSGELSRQSYKNWNWYRGGFGVDNVSVWRLLECKYRSIKLRIGVNMMFDTETEEGQENQKFWSNRFKLGKRDLTLNGIMHTFYTVPNVLHFSLPVDHNTLSVELVSQSIFRSGAPIDATCMHSQLRSRLGYMLLHEEPAVALYKGDIDVGIQLLTFDILSATIDSWIDFLKLVRLRSAWQPYSFRDIGTIEKYRPLLGDRANVADFVRSTRDLLESIETTIDKIDADVKPKLDDDQKSALENIVRKRLNAHKVLRCKMEDVRDNMEDMAERTKASAEEKQNESVRRLTLVASIFLPLTTACSLLSMSNRAIDIGALWWDWLGIVAIIGFLVLVGYRIGKAWDDFWHQSDKQAEVRTWKGEWNKARNDVLDELEKEKKEHTQGQDWEPQFTMIERQYRRAHLVPSFNRSMFKLSVFLFSMGAVASFLIGMFVDISLGAISLGGSAAGTVVVLIGSIIAWRLLKALFTDGETLPDRKTAIYQATRRQMIQFGRVAVSLESTQRTTDLTEMNSLLKWLVIFLQFLCKLTYPILSIFFGKLVFKIMLETLRNRFENEEPDRSVDLKGHSSKPSGKRGHDDVEANPSPNDTFGSLNNTIRQDKSRKKRTRHGRADDEYEQSGSREKGIVFVVDDASTKDSQVTSNGARHDATNKPVQRSTKPSGGRSEE